MVEGVMAHDHHHHGPCAHAEDQAARAPAALAAAEDCCAARGERLTPLRRTVLEALYASHRPVSAYDLIERIAATGHKPPAPVTIYRTLDFLRTQGFIHRLESLNAFIACPSSHRPDEPIVFMICESCGGVDEVASEPVLAALGAAARGQGFTPHRSVIEMTGRCGHCRR
jgi:Fur family zinc uptake transcriptional regulator